MRCLNFHQQAFSHLCPFASVWLNSSRSILTKCKCPILWKTGPQFKKNTFKQLTFVTPPASRASSLLNITYKIKQKLIYMHKIIFLMCTNTLQINLTDNYLQSIMLMQNAEREKSNHDIHKWAMFCQSWFYFCLSE